MVDSSQSVFIKGRFILDNYIAAHECMHEKKVKKKDCIVFKINFKKAYDRASWSCLFRVLHVMEFKEKWIEWIKNWSRLQNFMCLLMVYTLWLLWQL